MAVCLEERRSSQHQMESLAQTNAAGKLSRKLRFRICSAPQPGDGRRWGVRSSVLAEVSGGVGLNELQTSTPAKKKERKNTLRYSDKQAARQRRQGRVSVRGLTAVFNDGVWTLQRRYLLAVTAAVAISTCQSSCIKNVIKNHSNPS